ncbi:antibiotic biosynthesis monooxygenase [Thalassococcus sp. S3]|uniref:antibiotic biosynthesis monooxygenase family protein n=1 Tax=Thalassococcus sp. S3 TaxID=2017482 RepID=UPI0010242778|nr:antibiotic biosynthesis monooxygenase [Thalassococcus sp. S3]QBF30754.1 antibiotic biosynthesis monooxygenase [Thalassococcus sp. S3]
MYLTMNRFQVRPEGAAAFEEMWENRDSHLKSVPGFISFHLMRGPETEDHILYASHTAWTDQSAFEAWTKSEAFREAHKNAGGSRDLYLGPPQLEIFETVQELT